MLPFNTHKTELHDVSPLNFTGMVKDPIKIRLAKLLEVVVPLQFPEVSTFDRQRCAVDLTTAKIK